MKNGMLSPSPTPLKKATSVSFCFLGCTGEVEISYPFQLLLICLVYGWELTKKICRLVEYRIKKNFYLEKQGFK